MHPKKISISDFSYTLPPEQIAHYPLEERDQSKLLLYRDGIITEDVFRHLPQHIPAESVIIFNNTKVVEARLLFTKKSGATIEIFCLEPHSRYADIYTAMLQQERITWMCLIGGASKWKAGQLLEKKVAYQNTEVLITARYIEKINDRFAVELCWTPAIFSFAEVLHASGVMPLPPYIKRAATITDTERYQTIYAKANGSVAAPTAGLHFTPSLLTALTEKKIYTKFITLHVGAGTFKPVKSAIMEQHEMHAECIDVTTDTIELIAKNTGNIITAVGTTSLRTIESLYWLGVKIILHSGISAPPVFIQQWDPYELRSQHITATDALQALLNWLKKNNQDRLITTTQLLIAPGYEYKIVNTLITNFHQPQSTLLLLVAAFIGDDWKKVYAYALKNNFRFLSYGDACLLQRH